MSAAVHAKADANSAGSPDCKAERTAHGFVCERCALAWDDAVSRPGCSPVTFTRLRDAALAEADRIELTQERLVALGDRAGRYVPALIRAQEFRALVRMVDRVAAQMKAGAS